MPENINQHKLNIRNWELQFSGIKNLTQLNKQLIDNKNLEGFIPKSIIANYMNKFQKNPVKYAHPVSMLLTLALFFQRNNRQ